MILSEYSKRLFRKTFSNWEVPNDFADPMYNYLVYGYEPGSCFTAVLANDFAASVQHSHPSNSITAFKSLAGWINDAMPVAAYGSYKTVKAWLNLSEEDRRTILEEHDLIYTAKQETWLILHDGEQNTLAHKWKEKI